MGTVLSIILVDTANLLPCEISLNSTRAPTKVAHLLRGIPSDPTNTSEIKEVLLEIAKDEEEILSSLKNLL